jgi:hypothetical protein
MKNEYNVEKGATMLLPSQRVSIRLKGVFCSSMSPSIAADSFLD